MAADKEKYLVVVSVLEGRKFPKRASHTLLVEARFDGELLTTDPVEHSESPNFTQELAWELDKKSLHQHRLQRSSVRVQIYSQDSVSSAREAVGYVVLDLRSAPTQSTPKWLPLLHGKYWKSKPEIRLSLYIDEDKGSDTKSKEVKISTPSKVPVKVDPLTPRRLKPVLNELEGYYQIGPVQHDCEKFVLSVTVAFAANLLQLIPSNIQLPSTGYYFYYSVLGNDITNEVFHDLLNPTFPAERASVRLSATLEALRQFFNSQPGLQIHLCCGDQSLGSCEVPLNSLLRKNSTEIYMKPVALEGAFPLKPPKSAKLVVAPEAAPADQKPMVGVSVVMRREAPPTAPTANSPSKESPTTNMRTKTTNQRDETSVPAPPHRDPGGDGNRKDSGGRAPSPPRPPRSSPPAHDGSYTDTFESRTGSRSDDSSNDVKEKKTKSGASSKSSSDAQRQAERPIITQPASGSAGAAGSSVGGKETTMREKFLEVAQQGTTSADDESTSVSQHYLAVPEQPHHFSVSLDLRSIAGLHVQHPTLVFLRYTYIFFGSTAPILTQPPVEVRRGTEVLLPQSFCAFDFATTFEQLMETFERVPLVVEVWQRDQDLSQNICLGVARLTLSVVLRTPKSRAVHSSGSSGSRQTWSNWIPIENTDSDRGHMGDLQVVLCLEDWGPIAQQQVIVNATTNQQSANKPLSEKRATPTMTSNTAPIGGAAKDHGVSPRETQEYKVALELELWKQQQEALFEEQMKVKEKQLMKALAEEWKRNDKERELVVKRRMAEYGTLEEQLRRTLSDLEKREKLLANNEQELVRHRSDLQREHDRKLKEIGDASRRLKQDCDHAVELEGKKVQDLEGFLTKTKQHLAEAEARCQQQAREFNAYKEQQMSKPEMRLQADMNLLMLEKVELERKLDAATKSKIHYKQQWGRALKELARLKQKEQLHARAQLRKQQQEIDQMRMRYLAAEEKEVVKSERKELQELKNELNNLRENECSQSDLSRLMSKPISSDWGGELSGGGGGDAHVQRLIEERDTLLRTGVYTSEDRIISELDRQIKEAIAVHTSDKSKWIIS